VVGPGERGATGVAALGREWLDGAKRSSKVSSKGGCLKTRQKGGNQKRHAGCGLKKIALQQKKRRTKRGEDKKGRCDLQRKGAIGSLGKKRVGSKTRNEKRNKKVGIMASVVMVNNSHEIFEKR